MLTLPTADQLCLKFIKEQQAFEKHLLHYQQQRQLLYEQDLQLEWDMLQDENQELAGENQDLYLQLLEIQQQISQLAEQSLQLAVD